MSSASIGEVEDFVRRTRALHEQMLAASGIGGSAGTCLYASFVLQMTLAKFLKCSTWVCGGDGSGDGGARDNQGMLRGHYWVEGITQAGEHFVADITADQFGFEPVYFGLVAAARERYLPGDAQVVQAAVESLAAEIEP